MPHLLTLDGQPQAWDELHQRREEWYARMYPWRGEALAPAVPDIDDEIIDVLAMASDWLSAAEIARQLGRPRKTVDDALKSLLRWRVVRAYPWGRRSLFALAE